MFVVLINETDVIDVENEETPCEIHKKIIESTSTGFTNFQQQYDELLAITESKDEARTFREENMELKKKDFMIMKLENPIMG